MRSAIFVRAMAAGALSLSVSHAVVGAQAE